MVRKEEKNKIHEIVYEMVIHISKSDNIYIYRCISVSPILHYLYDEQYL